MEREPQSSPFKEFRQFYFGSLLRDIITLPGEWPRLHFEPGLTAQIDRPGRLSIPQICPFHYRVQWLAAKEFTDGAPSLIDATSVLALAPASEFAMAISPNGFRPMTQGFSS